MRTPTSTRPISAAALTASEVDELRARLTAAALPVRDGERIDLRRSATSTTWSRWRRSARRAQQTPGLCVQCNDAKQAPGWEAVPRPGPRHTVVVRTPTGHTYRSTAAPLPGHPPGRGRPD